MLHRRDAMLRLGQLGLGTLALPRLLRAERAPTARTKTARSCILVYLWGGPPQQDMWDMKPEAPDGIRSPFAPIDTVVPGIQICDQMPRLARHTDKLAVIRSYTHPSNTHEVGVYHTLTGREDNTLGIPRNQRSRKDFPCPGGVVSYFSPRGALPASVTIPRPIGHDGVTYMGTHAGFLGAAFDPMEMRPAGEENRTAPQTIDFPAGLDEIRLKSRFGLLNLLEREDRLIQKSPPSAGPLGIFHEQAYRLLASPEARSAFDLQRERDADRDRYGRNEYGEAFLLARRLIEAGVRLVTLTWVYFAPDGNVLNVWDNHGGTGSIGGITGYQMLKEYYCLPSLDQGMSALLEDLSERGLLDETLVAALGEFGRTPKINPTAGRDHWGPCQSVVLAGGGIRGGQVYGASDKHATYPVLNPVTPSDYLATIYAALGIAPETTIMDREMRPHRVSEGTPIEALFV